MSEDNNDLIDDIDETLDLSDLDEVDSVIDDLDKSLSDININVDEDSTQVDSGSDHTASEDETGEIQASLLTDSDLPNDKDQDVLTDVDSTTEVLLDDVNAAMDEIDNLQEIEDFDPLEAKDTTADDDSVDLPDFKSSEDITTIITVFETYSLPALEESLKKLSPDQFSDNGDYVRTKRKITSLIKKKEQQVIDEAQAEIDRVAREKEQENNILPIGKLLESAGGEEAPKKKEISKEISNRKSNLSKINIAPVVAAAKKTTEQISKNINQQSVQETKEKIAHSVEVSKEALAGYFANAIQTKTFATGFLIFFEIIKTTVPAIIVGLFVLNLSQKAVSPDILESLVSNDPARVQIGLELVKTNVKSEDDRKKYYDLAFKKLIGAIDQSWNPGESNSVIKKATFILSLNEFNFSDDDYDMNKKVKQKIALNRKTVRSTYEAFYNTEIEKLASNSKFVGSLREANIFLTNNKCLNSLEKFIEAERYSALSKSVKYGKTIAVNCLSHGENRAVVTQKIFDLQGKIDANIFMQEMQRRPASK